MHTRASKSAGFYRAQYGLLLAIFLWAGVLSAQSPNTTHGTAGNIAVWLDVNGAISPAMYDYIHRGLSRAAERRARIVILQIDTPGGLDVSMRKIIQEIIASPVPVVSFVAPGGARAASAGTYILYASHIAAMAPATNLGAATPVKMSVLSQEPRIPGHKPGNEGISQTDTQDAMTTKAINDAAAYIRGLARMRGRNADWAEQAVREGVSLTSAEALDKNVIDLIADDLSDLLIRIDGRVVDLAGQKVKLSTRSLTLEHIEQDWRTRLLAVITDPNIAYILMLVGFYGLILEFANPGTIVPGVIGAISLLLALFAFQVLPINYAGLALILLGIAFMLAEALIPGVGVLGIGGVVAFVIGSIMLIDTEIPGYGISIPLIIMLALISAAFCMVVLGMALKSRKRPIVTGREELIHSTGKVLEGFNQEGWVRIHGELWRARSSTPLQPGQQVRVTAIHGLTLEVEACQADLIPFTNQK
ncbi:nodulation protein NfeD [Nitrosomonas sp. HPC101]|uniref:NfeD family protein n=1 Tax=Nitrosomonas sp. HPC101 TaxID=1658667 RepID=UPI00136FDC3D|nr:nodulation protein NfeD [Nitrosomonas sp. HPC101]MXS84887.1 nodulation protein NfeD [Nitrosomonas sp. HPC101]